MRKKYLIKKITLGLLILLLLNLSCSSESIFSQISKLKKVTTERNKLATSSPSGISLVNNTLYIAAIHLWKKENREIKKVNFSNTYAFVNDLVNVKGNTYLIAQNKDDQLEFYKLENDSFSLIFIKDNLQPIGFLKSIGQAEVVKAYIHAQEKNSKKQVILDMSGNNIELKNSSKDDSFSTIDNKGKFIIESVKSKLWNLEDPSAYPVNLPQKIEIMPIINTNIRGFEETLIMTGGLKSKNTDFIIYSSKSSYNNKIYTQETGGFLGYFAREYENIILIGGNSGFAELSYKNQKFHLNSPTVSVEPGIYYGSQIGKVGLKDIIPVSKNTFYILTKGKGLWRLENKKLTKE